MSTQSNVILLKQRWLHSLLINIRALWWPLAVLHTKHSATHFAHVSNPCRRCPALQLASTHGLVLHSHWSRLAVHWAGRRLSRVYPPIPSRWCPSGNTGWRPWHSIRSWPHTCGARVWRTNPSTIRRTRHTNLKAGVWGWRHLRRMTCSTHWRLAHSWMWGSHIHRRGHLGTWWRTRSAWLWSSHAWLWWMHTRRWAKRSVSRTSHLWSSASWMSSHSGSCRASVLLTLLRLQDRTELG